MASIRTDSTNKRSFVEFAAGSEPTLTVLTADGGRIPAHNEVITKPQSLLRGLLSLCYLWLCQQVQTMQHGMLC
jgi:hypothetical protein